MFSRLFSLSCMHAFVRESRDLDSKRATGRPGGKASKLAACIHAYISDRFCRSPPHRSETASDFYKYSLVGRASKQASRAGAALTLQVYFLQQACSPLPYLMYVRYLCTCCTRLARQWQDVRETTASGRREKEEKPGEGKKI